MEVACTMLNLSPPAAPLANVNEYSARYSVMDREFYIPSPEQLAAQSVVNRQGRGAMLQGEEAAEVLDMLRQDSSRNYDHYAAMLTDPGEPGFREDRLSLARKLARMNLTLNSYTQWYWKADLHNVMNFLRLRADPHAQYEIRVYAEVMLDILSKSVPLVHEAFMEHRMGAALLSATSGLSKREWTELVAALGLEA